MYDESMPNYPSPHELVSEFHRTYVMPIRTTPQFDVPEREMRMNLIREETKELTEAYEECDFVEVVDAWADLVYVVYGAALTHGVVLDEIKDSHIYPPAIPKPQFFIPERGTKMDTVTKHARLLEEAYANEDLDGMIEQWGNLVNSVYSAAAAHGVNLDEVLAEVQRSNLSKLGADGRPMYREDGKVLKGPNFFAPDIKKALLDQGYDEETN